MGSIESVELVNIGVVGLITDESPIYDATNEDWLFQHVERTSERFLDETLRRFKTNQCPIECHRTSL